MRYFRVVILLIVIISSVSCQNKKENMNWEIIDFNKIQGETLVDNFFDAINKYAFKQVLVLNKEHVILLGDNSGDDYDNKESVVFVSLDGGKTLKKHVLGKGTLDEAVATGNIIFLVNETGKNGSNSSQLIKADSTFEKWEVVSEFSNDVINNINFYSATIGVASFFSENANQESKSEIKFTLDGGKNWKSTNLNISDGFGCYLFATSKEIKYIENNQLVKFNFITEEREVLIEEIAPNGYKCNGSYYKDPESEETYTFITNNSNEDDLSIKYLETQETIRLPNKDYYEMIVSGNYFHLMMKDGIYYNYVWSNDKGKTWNKEELRDFFVDPTPIGYFGKGFVYAFITCFKGKQEEKGGRFAIRKPAK